MNLTEAWHRVRDRLQRERLTSELDEELRFHQAMLERDQAEAGAAPEEVQRRARLALGNATYHKERARDLWSLGWLDDLLQDLRYAVRGLRARPGFTLAVVLTLALGIGANAAIFSIVDRLLFRPPPLLAHPALTHRIYVAQSDRGREGVWPGIGYARCLDFTRWTTSFARTAEFTTATLAMGVGEDARELPVAAVSASFFGFFDAPPALGRYYTTQEDTPPTGTPVVVLSHAYWAMRFGGRKDALGATLQIGPTVYTVIGVAPAGFVGLWSTQPPAAYVPISSWAATAFHGSPGDEWWQTYHWNFAQMIAERRPGVSVAQATADLSNAYRRSYEVQRGISPDIPRVELARPRAIVASVLAERGPNASKVGKVAALVAAMAVVVLLIACANVANLLLARALRRRREIAVRLALGVSRGRLLAQLLTESLLLALLGGAAGVVVAQWGGAALRSLFLPKDASTTVIGDPRTLIVAGAAALAAGLLTGLAPVWQSRRTNLTRDLKSGAREGTSHSARTRAVLLVVQGALSVVLLVGAGLFVRSLRHVRELRLGYDVDPVLVVELNMRGVQLDSARAVALRQQLLERAQRLPGVEHAALHTSIPFWRTLGREGLGVDLRVAGIDSVGLLGEFSLDAVTPDYFATMGTRILRGRGIGEQDVAGAPGAMVVSQAMAQVLWPGKDPIGQCVQVVDEYASTGRQPPCTYVVGVAEDIKSQSLSDDKAFYYYLASAQFHPQQTGLFVRTRGGAARQAEAIRRSLQPLMPGASYITATPFADVVGGTMRSWQLGAAMFGAFGALALLLAAIGLYSVIAYSVVQRTHELGVRIALGAQVGDVLGLVVGQGLRLGVAGIVIGGIIAVATARWLKPLLFQESARDPAVYALVAAVLLAVAVVASYVPARRAAHVDPNVALRAE